MRPDVNCHVPIAGEICNLDRAPANGPTYPNSVLSCTCAIDGWRKVADGPPLLTMFSPTNPAVSKVVCSPSVASLMLTACSPISMRLHRLEGYADSMNPSRMTKRRMRVVWMRRLSAVPLLFGTVVQSLPPSQYDGSC